MKKTHCILFSPKDHKNTVPVQKPQGMIHSFETFGALDGPGLRFVVFFEGCPLRCAYCHNRDMLDMQNYLSMSPQALLKTVLDYKPYFGNIGGVTVSGGDPLFQPAFLLAFLKLCKKHRIHTTIDTSLFTTQKILDTIIPYTDLFIVSLKHFDSDTHKCLTGVGNEVILKNIVHIQSHIKKSGKKTAPKMWFRYLILPGYTDTKKNINALIDFLRDKKFEKLELLPYHTFGIYKWEKLGIPYTLRGIAPPSLRSIRTIKERLEKEGICVVVNE